MFTYLQALMTTLAINDCISSINALTSTMESSSLLLQNRKDKNVLEMGINGPNSLGLMKSESIHSQNLNS